MKFAIAATLAVACLAAQAGPTAPAFYDQHGKLFGASVTGGGGSPPIFALYHAGGNVLTTIALEADVYKGGMVPYDNTTTYFTNADCTGVAYFNAPVIGARPSQWEYKPTGDLLFIADSLTVTEPISYNSYGDLDGCHPETGQRASEFRSSSAPVTLSKFVWPLVLQ